MLNLPIGDIAALRVVTTGKYISGWIDRKVIAAGQFPFPTNFGNCGAYYCTRGDVQDAPVAEDHKNSNLETLRFVAGGLAGPTGAMLCPLPETSCISASMPTGTTIIRPRALLPIGNQAHLSALRYQRALLRFFPLFSLKVELRHVFRQPHVGIVLLAARCIPIDGFDGSPAKTSSITRQFVPNLYSDNDTTWQIAQELRLTSRHRRGFPVGGRTVLFEPALRLRHEEPDRRVCKHPGLSLRR